MEVRRRPRAPPFFYLEAKSESSASPCGCRAGLVGGGWRDTPQVRPCRLVSAIHGAQRSRQPPPTSPGHIAGSHRNIWSNSTSLLSAFLVEIVVSGRAFFGGQHAFAAPTNPTGSRLGTDPTSYRQLPVPSRLVPLVPLVPRALLAHGYRSTIGAGAGWDCGTLHRMDAVAEPTGTYLRRVPRAHPAPPSPSHAPTRAVRCALCALQASKKTLTPAATATHCHR